MSSPTVVDFAKLLAGIPGSPNGAVPLDPSAPAAPANPAGVDLRVDRSPPSLYDQIRDARKSARTAEDGQAGDDASRADWRPVLENGTRALAEKTKDLEVAAYLIEALLRLHGFAGLRDGFRLARELIEKYWDGIYPLPDEEGLSTRVEALAQVLRAEGRGALTVPVAKVPLTEKAAPAGPLTLDRYLKAQELDRVSDPKARQKLLEQGAVTIEMYRQAAAESSAPFFITLVADLTASLDELDKLGLALDQRCGRNAPAVSNLRNQLTACLDAVRDVAGDKLPAPPDPAQAGEKDAAKAAGGAAGKAESLDVIRDREDAFRVLAKVAEFFKKTEPHSVVSYALDQVVRWGRMPLPDLLSELIPDESPRKNLFQRIGIKAVEAAKGESKK